MGDHDGWQVTLAQPACLHEQLGSSGLRAEGVIANRPPLMAGRQDTAGSRVASGMSAALEHADVEDSLYAAVVRTGLVANDGPRQAWATIRSGLSAGLRQPVDLDAEDEPPRKRARRD
jgi:hypothetical protein